MSLSELYSPHSALTQKFTLCFISPSSLTHMTHAVVTATNIFPENTMQQYPDPPIHLFHKVPTQLTE